MSPSSLNGSFDALRKAHLPAILDAIADVARASHPAGSTLVDMIDYHFDTGGKRLRGILPLLVSDLLGVDPGQAVPFGAACEMLHNATLVHDDLQDGDTHRRGRMTVWTKYGAPQAINLGDAMFYYTLLLIRRIEGSAELRESLYELTMRDTLAVIDGQEREFALKNNPSPQLDDYFAMVDGKTSALIALAMSGGALLAGASETTVAQIREMAHHLGILFQVQDDVLDLYGDKGRGRVGEDVAEGKRSFMVVHGLVYGAEDDRRRLTEIIDLPREETTDDHIREVTEIFDRAGSFEAALDELERRKDAAIVATASTGNRNLARLAEHLAELFLEPIAAVRKAHPRSAPAMDESFLIRMLPEVSRTFALSIEALPDALRHPVRVAYLLCRIVDTIEDTAGIAPGRRDLLFSQFRAAFDHPAVADEFGAAPEWRDRPDPDFVLCRGARRVFDAFSQLSEPHRAAIRPPIDEMAEGMREYAARADHDGGLQIRDLEDLDRYCYFVAGTVGRMLTSLFLDHTPGVDGPTRAHVEARAVRFGQGLQLVNILKDTAKDLSRGVCYIPEQALAERGVPRAEILAPHHRPRVAEVVQSVRERAAGHLAEAIDYTLAWPVGEGAPVRFFCAVPLALALANLEEVRRLADAPSADRVPKLSRGRVMALLEAAKQAVDDDEALRTFFARAAEPASAPA